MMESALRVRNPVRGGGKGAAAAEGVGNDRFLLLGLLGLALAMALITTAEGAAFRAHRGDAIELGRLLTGRLADWYTCAVLVPPLYWLTKRYTIQAGDWRRPALIHFGAAAAAACLKFVLYVPLRRLLDPQYQGTIFGTIGADFLGKLMFFCAVAGMLHAVFFYRRAQAEATEADALRRRLSQLERGGTIAVPLANGFRYLPPAEIDWVEAQGNYLKIHAGAEKYLVRDTMRHFSDKLVSEHFIRVHRSAIVNASSVRRIEPAANSRYRLTLRNGDTVMSGRSYLAALRALLP